MLFTCCLGLATLVPVFASNSDRFIGMVLSPVPVGSNEGSPVGTGMGNASVLPVLVRSMSWSMNWPQA